MRRVLESLRQASGTAHQASVYAALVARQLDHQSLQELPQIFQQLDLDGDGELELSEIKTAFETMFGRNSRELHDIERTFELLDLDGSGSINYTEFIAAGLGDRVKSEESLKAAFKAFDIDDNDNRITRNEFEQVVATLNVSEKDFKAEKVFSEFDADGDGTLDFEEWRAWVNTLVVRGGG
jgi:calcium-dependent protein kinase